MILRSQGMFTLKIKKDKENFFKNSKENKLLSSQAKSLHMFLMSLPDGFLIKIRELADFSDEPLSRVFNELEELSSLGYLILSDSKYPEFIVLDEAK